MSGMSTPSSRRCCPMSCCRRMHRSGSRSSSARHCRTKSRRCGRPRKPGRSSSQPRPMRCTSRPTSACCAVPPAARARHFSYRCAPRSPAGYTVPSSRRCWRQCRPHACASGCCRSPAPVRRRGGLHAVVQIHTSLTGRKEPFRPIHPGRAGLYVCGVTVYDYCHVGHARCYVAFDVIRRWLRYRGLKVTYVRNITDIDDKIIRRAAENNEPIETLTSRFIKAMHEDFAALAIEPPDHEPRATEHITGIISMIERLIERGYAYLGEQGDVLYAVTKFSQYRRLSGKRLADLRAGARVEIDTAKRDPLDFVLWKPAKQGEPAWPSPWGAGRPGWHIECSVMSTALLGHHFDLHGGGIDLK